MTSTGVSRGIDKPTCYSCGDMPFGSPPMQPSAPTPLYCAGCGCEVDPAAWTCAGCGASLREHGALTSRNPDGARTLNGTGKAHSKARAVFRFFLYLGSFVMFIALTWGQDFPGEDLWSSLFDHALYISIALLFVIGEAVNWYLEASLETRTPAREESLGEETFGVGLVVLFWGLYYGLKWQLLPAGVYARHLEGKLAVVLCALLLIILWSAGILSR